MAGHAAQSPRVTVVTRTRNRPVLLTRALQSVGAQSFQDLELVIVNDAGSTESVDSALESAPEWLRERTRVVTNETSHGREAALEDGLAASSCEFFAIHDDDDSWEPSFLAACVALGIAGVLFLEFDPAGSAGALLDVAERTLSACTGFRMGPGL